MSLAVQKPSCFSCAHCALSPHSSAFSPSSFKSFPQPIQSEDQALISWAQRSFKKLVAVLATVMLARTGARWARQLEGLSFLASKIQAEIVASVYTTAPSFSRIQGNP